MPAPYDPRVNAMLRAQGVARPRKLDIDEDEQIHLGEGQRALGGAVDFSEIPFPNLRYYDADHGNQTKLLAERIAVELGVKRPLDLEAVCIAGMFHDVGRQAAWNQPDATHNVRSADLAATYMRNKSMSTELIDITTKLIAQHTLSGPTPQSPLAQALWDADCLESARIEVNKRDGRDLWRKRKSQMITMFATNKDNREVWLRYRGWK